MGSKDELPYTVGQKPNTVRLYRRKGRRNLYLRTWDPSARDGEGGWAKESLGHDDVEKGKAQAAELHAKLVAGEKARRRDGVTLARLFALYEERRSPQKGERQQQRDRRCIAMWTRVLGAGKDPHRISRAEWEGFIEKRSSGALDARGRPESHPDHRGREVGPRTVEADLRWLKTVLNWAVDWQTGEGYLLDENVCRGYPVPQEKNPSRPVATDERVRAVEAVAAQVTMDPEWAEGTVPSHLPCVFTLAVETGRRLSSILALRYSDLVSDRGPDGSIRWRAESDKTGQESIVPLSPTARRALEGHSDRMQGLGLAGIGDAPLFPAPDDPSKPVSRYVADRWLRRAEKLADLEPQQGTLWHAYRRRWATTRKHLPATDVAEAGGWAGPDTLQHCYQHADAETMYRVVTSGGELREAK